MLFLNPHKSNHCAYSPIRFDYEIQPESVCVNFFIPLNMAYINSHFSKEGFSNSGLWNFDVAEVFITRSKDLLPYLELQVSPARQKFALIVNEPRKKTMIPRNLHSTLSSSFEDKVFKANFNISLNDIPGEGNSLYANFFAIIGEESNRNYFAWNINQDPLPDFHKP